MTTAAKTSPAVADNAETKAFPARFLTPLLMGSTLNPINSSMIATGLVGIGVDFHTGPGTTASLISVLYLCSAVMQPTMGKLSNIFGPRRVFLAGILILLAGGVLGSLAPAFGFLLLSRALIGIGTSAAYPTAMALVRRRADSLGMGVPSRVLGNFNIAAQVTVVFGLPIGGVLAGTFGWRALFIVNIPLALFALVMTLIGVPKDPVAPKRSIGALIRALDLPGIALFAGTITALLVFLADLTRPQWWLAGVVLVLGAALIWWERRSSLPLIDVRMLAANGALQRTYARQLLVGLGIYTALYGASQWMEQTAGLSPSTVGLVLLPLSALSVVIARVVSNKGWVRGPLILSAVALLATAVVMLMINRGSPIYVLVGMSLLFGLSQGMSGFANQAALYGQTSASEIAVASGLYRTFGYIGAIFSASVISIAFGATASDIGFHTLAWVIAGIGACLLLLSVLDRAIPRVAASD